MAEKTTTPRKASTTRKPSTAVATAEKATRPTRPTDRKQSAASARQEAAARGVTFTYDDVKYVVGPEAATDLELLEAMEDQRWIAACRGYLGKPQWDAFKEAHRDADGRIDAAHLEGLLQTLIDALGNS